jgi:hypothetical protein
MCLDVSSVVRAFLGPTAAGSGHLALRKTVERCPPPVRAFWKRPRQLCERKLKSVLVPSCLEVVCSSRDVEAIWGDSDAGLMAAQTPSGEGEPKGRG